MANLCLSCKEDVLRILKMFDKEGKHLHKGLCTDKVVFIENGSDYIEMENTPFAEALPLLESKRNSYPILLSAETPKDYLNLDIEVSKVREEYIIEFEAAQVKPVKEFLITEYDNQLSDFVNSLIRKK